MVPPGFSGLSVEASDIPRFGGESAWLRPLLRLLRAPGAALRIRVGGASADRLWWAGLAGREPAGTLPTNTGWLEALGRLARAVPSRVTVTVNLPVDRPAGEAAFALAAAEALPRGSLAAIEIGNEPDLYRFEPWLNHERPPVRGRPWTIGYTAGVYRSDYVRYAAAVRRVLPGIALQAPDITAPAPPWLDATLALGRLSADTLAVHRYPLCACLPRSSPAYPTVGRLLAPGASAGLASSLRLIEPLARAEHVRLVISEFNAVACTGTPRVSRSFATALWALDTLFGFVRAHVSSVYWHVRPGWTNAAFTYSRNRGISVAPEAYAMAIFAQLDGPGAQLLATRYTTGDTAGVQVWEVTRGRTATIVVVNEERVSARLTVASAQRSAGEARVQLLLGGSHGVTFGGRRIGSDGRWHGRPRAQTVTVRSGELTLSLPALSAATITLPTTARNISSSSRPRDPALAADRGGN